jgi:pimeloyl-ACP methyl ester carboxylesterase
MPLLHHEIIDQSEVSEWMVFVHGAGGSTKTWKYQIPAFSPYFKLLLIDLRDHGLSQKMANTPKRYTFELIVSDILTLLDHLKIQKAHFMSLSLGSMILQKLALMRPGMVHTAIMAGGVYYVSWQFMLFAHTAKFLTNFLPYRWMYLLFSWIVMPRKNHQHSRRIFIRQSEKLTKPAYDRWTTLYRDFRKVLKEFFHQPLSFRLLIVMGSQDYIFLKAAKKYGAIHHDRCTVRIMQEC